MPHWATLADQNGTAMFELSTDRIEFMTGEVNGTVVLLGPVPKPLLVNNFAGDLRSGWMTGEFYFGMGGRERALPDSSRLSILDSGC
jgi:hypothetical protein